jgi:hypothetical protein
VRARISARSGRLIKRRRIDTGKIFRHAQPDLQQEVIDIRNPAEGTVSAFQEFLQCTESGRMCGAATAR